ncbi:MAG: AsmA-like C-terminal region-containing protein, partial [Myxococcota bacterium]
MAALAERNSTVEPNPMRQHLAFLGAFEAVARTLLSRVILADRFEVQNGRVILVDERPPVSTPDGQPIRISLDQVNGRIVHHWLSGVVDLRLTANLVDTEDRKVPMAAEGMHNGGGDLQLEFDVSDLPLALLEPYITSDSGRTEVSGRWGGRIHYETHRLEHGSLSMDGAFSNLDLRIPVEDGSITTAHPKLRLSTHIEIDPDQARIGRTEIETENTVLSIRGDVERPLSEGARLRLSSEITGIDLEGLRTAIRSLPEEDSERFEGLLARVETGLIDRVRGSGRATIGDWERLLSGQLSHLPPDFTLSADLSGIHVRTRDDGALSGLGGTVEVSKDQVSLLNLSGRLNGEPLPTFNIRIHEFSNLFSAPEAARVMLSHAPTLPGIRPLFALFKNDPDSAIPPAIRPDIVLKINVLNYPVLQWPVRDAVLRISPTPDGSSFDIESGSWAGAPFQGYALWTHKTSNVVDFDIWTDAYQQPLSTEEEPALSEADAGEAEQVESQATQLAWASGRFEIPRLTFLRLPLEKAHGFFRLLERDLELLQIRADVEPTGKLLASGSVNLGRPEAVPVNLKLSIVSGDLSRIGESAGLSPGYATGRLHLSGELEGALRPQTPVLSDLTGSLRLDAREGEVKRNDLPLLVALAHASEGYNEYAQRDSIVYESMTTQLDIADGQISTRDFELEGPVRIYASGTLDVTRPPNEMIGVVGLFLFRGAGQFMETIPLVKIILPGSERGLVGAYYQVDGTFDDPTVQPLTGKSVAEDLPDVLVPPYALLKAILTGEKLNDGQTEPEKPSVPVQASEIPSSPSPADKLNDGEVHSGENETPELETPDSVSAALETLDS